MTFSAFRVPFLAYPCAHMVSGPEALASSTRLPCSMPEISKQLLQAGLSADFSQSYFEPLWIWDEYLCQEKLAAQFQFVFSTSNLAT